MSNLVDHKRAALDHLQEFRAAVGARCSEADVAQLTELIGHLQRAIEAFHMEAIRFRMYTIGRQLDRMAGLTPEVPERFERVRASLEAAGVHTRSVS
jgi:hypothetical protein